MVKKGMAFREAHEVVGKFVADAIAKGTKVSELPQTEFKKRSPLFDADVAEIFDVRRSLSARRGVGAPSPENVKAQIKSWRARIGRGD